MKKQWHVFLALAGLVALTSVPGAAGTLTEDFSTNPLLHGWRIFGDTNLFHWEATNGDLEVTWDSSRPNSCFFLPLGTVLTTRDDFSLAFNLRLDDAQTGGYGASVAIGLQNHAQVIGTNFLRSNIGTPGASNGAPDLVEFDYFPDVGYGATLWPACSDTNNLLYTAGGDYSHVYAIHAPKLGDWYHVVMSYTASNQTLVTTLTNAEQTDGIRIVSPLNLDTNFTDVRLDTVSISSYRDDGAGDSVLAHGAVDQIAVTVPPPPIQDLAAQFTNGLWQVEFIDRGNWLYRLDRSTDMRSWTTVNQAAAADAGTMVLPDPHAPAAKAFYRVRAERP